MRVVAPTTSIESRATHWMTHCRNDLVTLDHYHSTDELLVHMGSYGFTAVQLGRFWLLKGWIAEQFWMSQGWRDLIWPEVRRDA